MRYTNNTSCESLRSLSLKSFCVLPAAQDNGKYDLKRKHDDTLSDELLTMLKVSDL